MIGVIAAMHIEADTLKKRLTDVETETISEITYYSGKINGSPVVVATSGVGKVFGAVCAQTMILRYGVDKIINVGVCGSLTNDLEVGDILISTGFCQHDIDTTPVGDIRGIVSGINMVHFPADEGMRQAAMEAARHLGYFFKLGGIATGDRFVAGRREKSEINRIFGSSAADMESGAIAQVCCINDIPFLAVRVASDDAEEDAGEIYRRFVELAAHRSIGIVEAVIRILSSHEHEGSDKLMPSK